MCNVPSNDPPFVQITADEAKDILKVFHGRDYAIKHGVKLGGQLFEVCVVAVLCGCICHHLFGLNLQRRVHNCR